MNNIKEVTTQNRLEYQKKNNQGCLNLSGVASEIFKRKISY